MAVTQYTTRPAASTGTRRRWLGLALSVIAGPQLMVVLAAGSVACTCARPNRRRGR